MTPYTLKLKPRSWLFYFLMIFYGSQLQAQCDTIFVNLSDYPPDYDFSLPSLIRNGQCCQAVSTLQCLNFVVTLNPTLPQLGFFKPLHLQVVQKPGN